MGQGVTSKQSFKIFLIVLGGVFLCTSPFWSEPFRYQKNDLTELRKQQFQKVAKEERKLITLRESFEEGNITSEEYITSIHSVYESLDAVKESNSKEIQAYYKTTEVLDWRNSYVFLIALGTRIPSLFFPLLLIYLFKSGIIKLEDKKLKTAFITFTSACLGLGIFWMTWVFWPFNDVPFNSYLVTIIGSSLLLGTAITQFMLWKEIKLEKQKRIIRYLNRLLIVVIPSMVKDIHVEEYEELKWEALDYETK